MWFLFVEPEICLQLPSDSTSRQTPLLLDYTLPTIWTCSGLAPVRDRPWRANLKKALLMECPNIKNRDTLLKYPYFLSIYLIALYLLSYSEFFVFQQPRSSAATTVTFLTSSFSLWFSPILLKLKNSTKCLNSRIFRYLSFGVMSRTLHVLYAQTDPPPGHVSPHIRLPPAP